MNDIQNQHAQILLLHLFKKINCLWFHDQLTNQHHHFSKTQTQLYIVQCYIRGEGLSAPSHFCPRMDDPELKHDQGFPLCLHTVLQLERGHLQAPGEFQPAYTSVPSRAVYHLYTEKNRRDSRGNRATTVLQLSTFWNPFFMSGKGEVLLAQTN